MIAVASGGCLRGGPVALLMGALVCVSVLLACEAAPAATVAPSPLSAAEGRPSRTGAEASGASGVRAGSPSPGDRGAEALATEASASGSLVAEESPPEVVGAGPLGASATPEASPNAEEGSEPAKAAKAGEGAPAKLRHWQRGDEDSGRSGAEREAAAFANKEAEVKELFAAAGVRFPPSQVLFRVFKEESELEVWATDDRREPLRRIATYRICAASGGAGPKTRSGDHQVPEGFYEIDFYKPRSDYYLALHVNYPNRRDRSQRSTGSAIMIHGRCASIGCLAMSDDRIQELWVIGRSLRSGRVQVHIFPQRAMDALVETTTKDGLKGFWRSLAEGKRRFDADPRLPKKIGFDDDGNYVFD